MKCQHCGMNEATFYMKSNVNGHVSEQHLCAECAAKLGYTETLKPVNMFSSDFFSRPFRMFEPLFEDFGARMLTEFPEPGASSGGRDQKVQPVGQETGLVDTIEQTKLREERQVNALRAQMKAAVDAENFEEAAKLRDELKKLQG